MIDNIEHNVLKTVDVVIDTTVELEKIKKYKEAEAKVRALSKLERLLNVLFSRKKSLLL